MKLSEVQFRKLRVHDKVISALGNAGEISKLTPEGQASDYSSHERYDTVTIKWNHGAVSHVFHMNSDSITTNETYN